MCLLDEGVGLKQKGPVRGEKGRFEWKGGGW